jgi:hypothetical protein
MPMAAVAATRDGAASMVGPSARRGRAHAVAQVLSLAPLVILVAVAADPQARLLSPLQPMPALLGLPADALLGALTLAWAGAGALLVRLARSPLVESLALLTFTVPATVLAVLAPALLMALVPRG